MFLELHWLEKTLYLYMYLELQHCSGSGLFAVWKGLIQFWGGCVPLRAHVLCVCVTEYVT